MEALNAFLQSSTLPHSTSCGEGFSSGGFSGEKVAHATLNQSTISPQDFFEERNDNTFNLCGIDPHPLQFKSCVNRFGLASFDVTIKDVTVQILNQDDRCVGNRVALTHIWQQSAVIHFRGDSQDSFIAPNGGCIAGEPDFEYTVPADSNLCEGFIPCSSLIKVSCLESNEPISIGNPNCVFLKELPRSLLFPLRFCPTVDITRKKDAFCSVDKWGGGLTAIETSTYCSNPSSITAAIVEVIKYCPLHDDAALRFGIIGFCPMSSAYLGINDDISSVEYCRGYLEYNRLLEEMALDGNRQDRLSPLTPPKVDYCSTYPVAEIEFCSQKHLNPTPKASFCSTSAVIPIQQIYFCSQII